MDAKNTLLISDLRFEIFFSKISFFRFYQDKFLSNYGRECTGHVIEVGGETQYQHQRFFPNASKFTCSNIDRDYTVKLDITQTGFENRSQDAYSCTSVLEHIFDLRAAVAEMARTLRSGGKLLLTVPFAYPYHDKVDYWRLSKDAYAALLEDFDIVAFVHLGGTFASIVDNLRRPRSSYSVRSLLKKALALLLLIFGRFLEQKDGFPLGYAVYAIRK